ncbi:Rieske 2Fe-2S domain-containing protein [Kribbella sp. CA-253562]|uniref:Rieske (2Fe-2S) protein n=1 Tax=Kribbella sp. CA-253562 TaxID=3239942 RepID=UPI003D8AA90A
MSDDRTAPLDRVIADVRDRRSILRGAAVAGLAGVGAPLLAACGGDGDAGGTATGGQTSSAPSSAPTSAPSSAPSSAGGPVLGPAADVPVGGGAVFKDAKVVVTQPTAGQYKGFSAVCTHQGCIVAKVENGEIDCNCHGSKFSATDGSVKSGPAREPLAAVTVSVQGGNIVGSA